MKIHWIKKSKRGRNLYDVSVKIWKNNYWSINFHNCVTRITRSGYIQVGYTDDRLCFKPATRTTGQKLTKISSFTDRVSMSNKELFKKFEGDYNLQRTPPSTDEEMYWYIDLNNKMKEGDDT